MQGRDTSASPVLNQEKDEALNVTPAIEQTQEERTQLEDLQRLLEMAHENEKKARDFAKQAAREANAIYSELEAVQKSKAHEISSLEAHIENISAERNNAVWQKNESLRKLEEVENENFSLLSQLASSKAMVTESTETHKKKMDEMSSTLANVYHESDRQKKVILKQHKALTAKDVEIQQLQEQVTFLQNTIERLEKNKSFSNAVQFGKQSLFKPSISKPEIEPGSIIIGRPKNKTL